MSNKFGRENLNRQEKVYTSTAASGGSANPTKSVPVTREIKWVPECGYVIVPTKSGYISAAKHIFRKDIEKIFKHDKFVVEGYKYKFTSENITPKKREINFRKMNKISDDIQLDYKRISEDMQARRELVMRRVTNAKNTYGERTEYENGSKKKVFEVVFIFDYRKCFERILCLKYHQPDFLKATAVKTLFTECQ
jgi:hypothetical protein